MLRRPRVQTLPLTEIPVMRPKLPEQKLIAKYIKRIDQNRIYTNYGPLQEELTSRLAEYFGVAADQVLLVANGTVALQGAIETVPQASEKWILPSWTFVASAEAVASARKEVVFGDVDSETWTLQFSNKTNQFSHMVVAPFGAAPQVVDWQQSQNGGPLVIDAASCFDACKSLQYDQLTQTVVMVSLHATKLVTTGEGGVLIGDASWLADVKQWSNFGFRGQRVAGIRGTNAKLSEYGAAIGLASLDEWERTRSALLSLTARYVSALRSVGLSAQPGLKDGTVSSTIVTRFPSKAMREAAQLSLSRHHIATRAWWSEGIHRMESFANCQKREDLVVTEALGDTTLGLPFYIDMTDRELDRIIEAIDESEVLEP